MTNLPRRRLLDLWKVLAARIAARFDPDADAWPSGDSLRDAEQLVCLLYPAMRMPGLGFADPDTTGPDVLAALATLGDHKGIPHTVTEVCTEYFAAYTDKDGRPLFAGGPLRALDPAETPTPDQQALETVESFSIAVTLSLSVLAFVRERESRVRAAPTLERLAALRGAASTRLTHAMNALCESFVADAFRPDSAKGRTLLGAVLRDGPPDSRRVRELLAQLRPVRTGLGGLGATGDGPPALDDETTLFSCGWAWGRVRTAGRPGSHAEPEPSLHFTVAAMDGIVDLFSSRQTLLPGLLNREQLALAQQLMLRWELAQRYWSALARFGGSAWPLQDIPWRGGDDSDYRTLHVASIVIHNLMRQGDPEEPPPSHELAPLVLVLGELAGRARLTRRALPGDPAIALHSPGLVTPLPGTDRLGPPLGWTFTDFAPALLKRTLQVAALTRNVEHRDTMLALADTLGDHVWGRRLDAGPAAGLWDDPGRIYPAAAARPAELSWRMTERVVEVLVVAAAGIAADLAPSRRLAELAADMIREADHLFAREMLTRATPTTSTDAELHLVAAVLARSRDQAARRPGVAVSLAADALRRLDELSAAREQAGRG
ncbi:SCO2524 family protein [Yinghuangia sp. YIM S09857]|uniref:SCO2524 family protein n=1 Tax=Yinghuangia sp. YIM S09857 TaxID=3436929 RepID=UPI003F529214